MTEFDKVKELISKKSEKLHEQIGATIDVFIINENLGEDAVTLNIVFNALSNNMRAIVENNQDIPLTSVEAMIQSVSKQIRKGYVGRKSNQN